MVGNQPERDSKRYHTRRKYLKVAAMGGAVSVTGCLDAIGGGGETITVGTAFPYTGVYSASAERQKDGVELAVSEINDNGGIGGRTVETVDRDTELNAEVNARRIRNLLNEEEVDLLIANLSGGITTQTQSLAAEAGVPYMAGSRTSPPFHYSSDLGDASFAPGPLNIGAITAPVQAAFELDLGSSFYATIADYGFNLPEAWESVQNYITDNGGSVEGSSVTPLGTSDFSSIISDAMDSDAEIMLALVYGNDMVNFTQQARDFGLHEEMEIINPVQSVSWLQLPSDPSIWEDVYFGMSWAPVLKETDDTAADWAERFENEYDYPGESFAGITYTGMMEFARAIEESGGVSVEDIASVIDGSTTSSYVMDGDIEWRACTNGAINPGYLVTQGRQADNMLERGEWDLVNIVETFDIEQHLPPCSYFDQ